MIDILPRVGSALLIGKPQAFQSFVAFSAAMAVAWRGDSVTYLSDDWNASNILHERVIAFRQATQMFVGQRLRLNAVSVRSLAHSPVADYLKVILALPRKPQLIVRDLSLDTSALSPGEPWLRIADELAKTLSCCVVTAAHSGPTPAPFDLTNVPVDEAWRCSVGVGLNVTLTHERPADGRSVKLSGRDGAGLILFEAAP